MGNLWVILVTCIISPNKVSCLLLLEIYPNKITTDAITLSFQEVFMVMRFVQMKDYKQFK